MKVQKVCSVAKRGKKQNQLIGYVKSNRLPFAITSDEEFAQRTGATHAE